MLAVREDKSALWKFTPIWDDPLTAALAAFSAPPPLKEGFSERFIVFSTGRENDGTGLYYYRARYYSPTMQRFVSEDPILRIRCLQRTFLDLSPRFAPQPNPTAPLNAYVYVDNNPIRFADPSGLDKDPRCTNRCVSTCGAEGAICGYKIVYLPTCELVCTAAALVTTGGTGAIVCGTICGAITVYETYQCLEGTRQCMTTCTKSC